jgi:hypothetical protein
VLTPHLPAHNGGGVTAVSNRNASGVIDQVWYLLAIAFVGGRKVDGCELPFGITSSMEFKPIPPTLVVLAEASSTLSDPMSVSPYESADGQHGRVNEAQLRIFDE